MIGPGVGLRRRCLWTPEPLPRPFRTQGWGKSMYSVPSSIASTYNALSDVVVADHALSDVGRELGINSLLGVIRAYGLEEFIGLRLLHKHNDIAASEIMLEDSRIDEEGFALITRATSISKTLGDVSPNSWILCEDGFVPFEFSRSYLLRDSGISPITHSGFFNDLANALRHAGLAQLIGPALTSSALVDEQRPAGADLMLESSALDDRANVLRFAVSGELSIGSPIETFWTNGSTEKPESSVPAEREKVTPARVCTRICPSVQNPPVHQGTYIHRRS